MPHYSEDRCSECGNFCSKELLTVKRATFHPRTQPSKVTRSRTVSWLCETCREKDPDWNREAFNGPGHTSPARERARKIDGD